MLYWEKLLRERPVPQMRQILILGGGAAGLAAAIGAAQTAGGSTRVILLDKNRRPGKKLLATGNGRCNLDNLTAGEADRYFTSSPRALSPLLAAIGRADLSGWWAGLGLVTRPDETGRVYPYSNQAADLTGLLLRWVEALGVCLRPGCRVESLRQGQGGYLVQFENEAGQPETLRADGVICALGGSAGPQFGTDGFGPAFAGKCGGRLAPVYPCLTPLACPKDQVKGLAGLRSKAGAALMDGERVLAREQGEVQFTDYGLSGICIMQLSGLLAPGRGPKNPAVSLDLFPALSEAELTALLAARAELPGQTAESFWLGLLARPLGAALWARAGLPGGATASQNPSQWQKLAKLAKDWRFGPLTPCGWKQAQTTGGGLSLEELEPESFGFRGCPGLYFVGETLDCAGSCGGFNLHWAFGSGLVAGRHAARPPRPTKPKKKK